MGIKITDLPAASGPLTTDVLPMVEGATATKKATLAQVVGANLGGTIASVAAASSAGVSPLIPRMDHVHGHGDLAGGSFHALATDSAHGFLDSADYDAVLGKSRTRIRLLREELGFGLGGLTAVFSGAAASAAIVAASAESSMARLATGTTATGYAALQSAVNIAYTNAVAVYDIRTIFKVLQLSNATDEFATHLCFVGDAGGNGFSISYARTNSVNWYLTKWSGATPTYTVNTGLAVDTNYHRFRAVYTTASTGTVDCYIDNVNVGQLTSIGSVAAQYIVLGKMAKSVGTGVVSGYMDFAEVLATLNTARAA